MASKIENIYSAFSSMVVNVDGESIRCDTINQVLNTYQSADLPVRVLSPMSRFIPAAFYSTKVWNAGVGSQVNEVMWTVCEYFLYEPVAQTLGQRSVNGPIIEFMKNYADGLATGGLILPENCWIESVAIKPDVVEYPLASNNFYFGAIVTVTIKEKIP